MRDWLCNIRYGVSNLTRFAPIIWKWRGWDYEYSYRVFLFSLGQTALGIDKYRNHENWMRDVEGINKLLGLWKQYIDAIEIEDEDRAWKRFHHHLEKEGRTWWD